MHIYLQREYGSNGWNNDGVAVPLLLASRLFDLVLQLVGFNEFMNGINKYQSNSGERPLRMESNYWHAHMYDYDQ